MKIVKNKKGQVRVIEALLASLLLMACLAVIPAPSNQSGSTANLASSGQNVLLSLDSNGQLATLVDSRNWASLKASIESTLPLTVWFNLTVFNNGMNVLNPFPISNGGAVSDKVVSLDYICVSQNSNYTIYILRLQLSEVGAT
jgi:hypothetical protein